MGTGKSYRIYWRLTSDKPKAGSRVIAETLDGEYIEEQISDDVFDIWDDSIVRWAYSPSWFNENFSKQMNPPKEDKKEEKNDKKLHEDAMDYGFLLGLLFSVGSDGNAKCRECCCDGLDNSQDDKMDGNRSRFFNYFNEYKKKRAGNEKDSSKSESVSEKYERYTRLRNAFYYDKAGTVGSDASWRDAVERALEYAPELEAVARELDAWYFFD